MPPVIYEKIELGELDSNIKTKEEQNRGGRGIQRNIADTDDDDQVDEAAQMMLRSSRQTRWCILFCKSSIQIWFGVSSLLGALFIFLSSSGILKTSRSSPFGATFSVYISIIGFCIAGAFLICGGRNCSRLQQIDAQLSSAQENSSQSWFCHGCICFGICFGSFAVIYLISRRIECRKSPYAC